MASNVGRLSILRMCLDLALSEMMKGRLISVSMVKDSSLLAFSAASFSRWRASLSALRSILVSARKLVTSHSRMRLSKSSPPR